ncbi:S8 family serine peptidase [Aureispira sp. CCB-E]|uniref:S8 family serine peptidase n=1 Tax=Aureispira sp. CCB-E TaxID=3051121 RepID=UPI002869473C|nr:S8 family serine peptidase [Aureispira sp. CCB-E]WMX16779.1 S8 family serine peptidase [Aureispira sp. CCB-E]
MNRISILTMALIGILMGNLHAQDYTINFLKGAKHFESNISDFKSIRQLNQNEIFSNRFYRFVQFNAIPTPSLQKQLAAADIRLLEYIPNKVYVASIPIGIDINQLQKLNIRSIVPIEKTYKIGQRLEDEDYPDWAMEGNYITVTIQYYQDIKPSTAKEEMKKLGLSINQSMDHAQMVVAQLLPTQISKVVDASFIRYVDIMSEPGKPESDDGRHLHRANAIDGDFSGARNYDGTGVTFAVNDDGFVGPHIDFKGRTNQQDVAGDFAGDHGDMVAGIAGGAGNLDPLMRGMATGAYMHIRQYVASMAGTLPLHQDSAVLIFSSSYSNGCNGGYTNTTVLVDQEIYNNPTLMQTFSAGNSNNQDCGYGAGTQWGNITGGHKIGKNVIATANLNASDGIANSSSRGPASDGRIKPDISAHGVSHMSTDPNNAYAPGGGTSAAAPGICGVMAQMHHAYRDLNGGNIAPSALLKAALLNTANDLGNDGPDFIFGWGKVNGLKAVQLLEDNRYFNATLTQGGTNSHSIAIPAGVQRAKIMIYWADREASTAAATALVNDLDATVTDPSATVHLPWLLDHTPNATTLGLPATKGADHLNNVEQIAIDNPAAGTYTLDVAGTTIPMGTQEYYVVYEFLMDDITVIHPMGGEGLIPGANDRIHWDAYGTSGTFLIEYTTDNGATWTTIAAAAPGTSRFLNWTIPATITGEARVRISRSGVTDESDANFTIIERPQNIRVNRVCPNVNEIQLAWDAVPGATGYDVFLLGQKFMDSIGTTTALTYNVAVTDINDPQWFSVRAVGSNGIRGLRQIAVNYAGASGGTPVCFLSCSGDNDAGVASLDAPSSILETCGGVSTATVSMTVENIGLFTESNFPVYYQFGNDPMVTETYTANLAAGGSASFSFTTPINIPTAGVYELKVWTGLSADSTHCNDTITQMITVLDPLGSFPYAEDFDGGTFPPPSSYIINGDNDRTWELVTTTGAAGGNTAAMFVNNFSYNAPGQEDIFSFVTLDMTQAPATASAMLTFDVAYRRFSANLSDDLRIDLSTDCGQTFSQVYFKGGAALATGPDAGQTWQPNAASDWRNDTVDLSAYLGSNVVLRFVNINGYGNNLYVDNINVDVLGALPPVADFSSNLLYTCDGTIEFKDESGNQPSQWLWTFGDGGVSTQANPTYTYASSGTYNVSLQVTNSLGVDTEVKNAYIVVEYPEVTSTNNGAGCPNTSIALSATNNNGTLHWYDGANSLVHVGDTFNTPTLVATTNYQVQNIILTPTLNVGPANGTAVGGGGYHGSGFYGVINFTAYNSFELISVWVDADGAGPRTFTLWDGSIANGGAAPTNTVLAQTTVNLVNGGQRILLNFQVPGPGDYSIGGNNMDLYRNNTGTAYPYTLPNVLTMTSSAANNPTDFYYYLYDWEVRLDSCAGALSTVTAEIVEAQFTAVTSGGTAAFTDASTGATSWLWNFGDGNTSTQQNPTHTYTSNGPHYVTLTINNGACSFADSVSVSVGIEEISNNMNLVILPNPATSETTLRFSEVLPTELMVEVIAVNGKVLLETQIPAGATNKTLDVSHLPPAMYLIRLSTDAVVDVRKLIISK